MFKRTKVCSAALVALGGYLLASTAMAQDATRVEITGSRIKTIQGETASPIVTLSAEQIKVEGVRNVESLLNNLPQVFADQGAQVSNGATGTATVNLRNFGSTRTLVLVNGRRLPAGSPADVSADLTQIPIALIKRVELLTGGASAVYGSDAVSGVVNFILDDRFQGLQLDVNTQFYNHKQKGGPAADAVRARNFAVPDNKTADGEVHDFSLTLGGNFADNKGNAVVHFGYKKEEALLESERDFSACALNYNRSQNRWTCGGSGTSYPGRFTDLATFDLTMNPDSSVRNYTGATDAYNFAPLNYFQRPSERMIFSATGRYDINDQARVYSELSWMDNRTVAQIAPSGIFGTAGVGGGSLITANFDNPLLSADWRTQLGLAAPGDSVDLYVFRRNVEGGGRQDDRQHSSYRSVIGVKGDAGPWSYDAFAQYGRVLFQETYKNDFSNIRILRATDVVTDPTTGAAVCRSVLDGTDPACVPYNIWSYGAVTPAALSYLQIPLFQRGFTSQGVLSASVTGDLGEYGVKSPFAKNGLGVSFGLEHRGEKLELSVDPNFESGDGAGQGGPTTGVGGSYSVKDVFAELRMPIIEKAPFAELLSVNGSFRRSSYSTGKKTNTFGVGLEYMPVTQLKIRGSVQRAARAANIIELYSSQTRGLYDNDADPCAGATPSASLAECARTGVTAGQYGSIADSPAGQYNQITGGNPDLKPEKATSFTLGAAISPMKDFTITLDYFSMKIDDVINNAPPTQILTNCLRTGDPALCGLIQRDGAGTLWASPSAYILATNANLSTKKTSGFDIGLDYGLRTGMGLVSMSYVGTLLRTFESEDFPGSGEYDCAGKWGNTCGTPLPKYRHKLRATWDTPMDASVSATWRYISAVDFEGDSDNPVLRTTAAGRNANPETLGARNYFDIAAAYNLSKNITLRAIVNNLFDKDPPLRPNGAGFVNGNTYPVVYDALGRKVSVGLTAKF